MPVKRLPPHPDLAHLKYQARDLMKLHAARDIASAQRMREFHPRFSGNSDAEIFEASCKLSDAQLTIAREYGFASWTQLREHVVAPSPSNNLNRPHDERIEDPDFRRAVDLLDTGNAAELRSLLSEHPGLTKQRVHFDGGNYFKTPTLLEFIAENPVRRGTLPGNIVEVAKVILDAGVERSSLNDALGLVCSGRVARECGVQIPLIDLLCDAGADAQSALHAAALHGEDDAVEALLQRGARLDLPVAAALGRVEDFRRLIPIADAEERHMALAAAAQFGHVEIVKLLLDAGEDADRYNPAGSHSHSTPLHQAAAAGHEDVVRLLVGRGARLDLKDVLWQGTPADWAAHEGHPGIESYLRGQAAARESRE